MRNFSGRLSAILALGVVSTLALSGCTQAAEEIPVVSETPADETSVEIPGTPVGQVAQKMVDVMNADDDTTAADWEGQLHDSFTAKVSIDDFVDLLNTNIRPAQPFVPTAYEGADRQSVTTLDAAIGDPIDLTISIDSEGLIIGLTFTPAAPES
jgi:hypothetical protein